MRLVRERSRDVSKIELLAWVQEANGKGGIGEKGRSERVAEKRKAYDADS